MISIIDADVEISELGLHADAGDAGGDAGVVGSGRDWDSLTDLQIRVLAVGGANTGILQDAGVDVGEQRVDGASGDADSEVVGVEVSQRVEGEVGRSGGSGGAAAGRRGAGSGRGSGKGLGSDADGGGKRDPDIALDVAADLEDGDVDDDFGTGTVEIVQQLLGEEELVWRGAHDDGVLAGDEVDLDAGVEEITDGHDDFIGVVLLAGVGEVEGLDGLLVELGALGAGVLGDEDGVRGNGLIEGAGDGADDAQGIGPT